MKKRIYVFGCAAATATAIVASLLYAKTEKAWLLAFTGCAVMLLLWCITGWARTAGTRSALPPRNTYRKKARYISPAEFDFLQVLRAATGAKYEVCVQAPLVAVIEKTSGGAFRNELFRVADYLIVDRVTYEPLLLVELNDSSHNRADRVARDRKVAEICAAARMPLVAFTTAEAKDIDAVRRTIRKALR